MIIGKNKPLQKARTNGIYSGSSNFMDKDNKLLKFFIEKTILGLLILLIVWFGSDMNIQEHWHLLLWYFPFFYVLGYLGDLLEKALIKFFSKFIKVKK